MNMVFQSKIMIMKKILIQLSVQPLNLVFVSYHHFLKTFGFPRTGRGDVKDIYADVTVPIMEAFDAFNSGDYDTTVAKMKPLRYEVQRIGGSHAQVSLYPFYPHKPIPPLPPHTQTAYGFGFQHQNTFLASLS